jgi:hypothetical protein
VLRRILGHQRERDWSKLLYEIHIICTLNKYDQGKEVPRGWAK